MNSTQRVLTLTFIFGLFAIFFLGKTHIPQSVSCDDAVEAEATRSFPNGTTVQLSSDEHGYEALQYITCQSDTGLVLQDSERREISKRIDRAVDFFVIGDRDQLFVDRPIYSDGSVRVDLILTQIKGGSPVYTLVVGQDEAQGVDEINDLLREEFDRSIR